MGNQLSQSGSTSEDKPRTAVLSAMDDYGEQLPNDFPLTVGFRSGGEYVEIPLPEILNGISHVSSKCGNWYGQCRILNFGNMRFLNWLRVTRKVD